MSNGRIKRWIHNEGVLETKYFLWFFLMLVKAIQVTAFPAMEALDYFLAAIWVQFFLWNFTKPKEMALWFLMGYFTNIMHWFTDMALINKGGSRILLLDIFLIVYLMILLIYLAKNSRVQRMYLGWLIVGLTAFWFLNMVKGFVTGGGGYVIGESRFYLGSILLLGIVNHLHKSPNHSYSKILKIISLCSLNVMFFILMQVLVGAVEGEGAAVKRFNPGNGLVQLPLMGLLVTILDIIYKRNYHIIRGHHLAKIGIYLGFIFISGVRGVLLMVVLMSIYFLVFSTRLPAVKKIVFVFAVCVLGVFAIQLSPVQRVMQTQKEYIEILMGEGDPNAKTTSDFRMEMWGVFWDKLTEDKVRMLFGRPFGLELIDISSFYWARREGNSFVDNSLAHNDYLAISMTNGILFTAAFLLLLIAYVIRGFYMSVRIRDPDLSYFFLFFAWCLVFQVFQSGLNAEIKHYGWSICLWVYLGIIGSLLNLLQRHRREWKDQKSQSSPPPSIKVNTSRRRSRVSRTRRSRRLST